MLHCLCCRRLAFFVCLPSSPSYTAVSVLRDGRAFIQSVVSMLVKCLMSDSIVVHGPPWAEITGSIYSFAGSGLSAEGPLPAGSPRAFFFFYMVSKHYVLSPFFWLLAIDLLLESKVSCTQGKRVSWSFCLWRGNQGAICAAQRHRVNWCMLVSLSWLLAFLPCWLFQAAV